MNDGERSAVVRPFEELNRALAPSSRLDDCAPQKPRPIQLAVGINDSG
jgi:hypothetical protein